jgi:exosortase/archaeosortase family protein
MAFFIVSVFSRQGILKHLPSSKPTRWRLVGILPVLLFILWPWQNPENAQCGFVFALAGLAYAVGGKTWLIVLWPGLIFLGLCSGIPTVIEQFIIARLQEYASWLSFHYCKWFLNNYYIKEGNGIFLLDISNFPQLGYQLGFIVNQECSGYKSLLGMSILAFLYTTVTRFSKERKCVLFVIAIGLALLFNTVRLLLSATFIHYGLKELTGETPHAMLGHLMMGIEVILLFWLSCRWRKSFSPKPSDAHRVQTMNS